MKAYPQRASRIGEWIGHARQCDKRPDVLRFTPAQAVPILQDLRDFYSAREAAIHIDHDIMRIERGELERAYFGTFYGIDIRMAP